MTERIQGIFEWGASELLLTIVPDSDDADASEDRTLDLLAKLTARPAGILGMDEGTLAVGAPADLVVIDLDREWRIEPDQFISKSKNSPFDDHPVRGAAAMTVLGRRTVFAG